MRKGKVYIQGIFAGFIRETDEGYCFQYHETYLHLENPPAVSLTMPVRREPYLSNVLFPFFDGLIPEGWLLNVVSRNWKIDRSDRFGLLLSVCRDCIGDVWIERDNTGEEE